MTLQWVEVVGRNNILEGGWESMAIKNRTILGAVIGFIVIGVIYTLNGSNTASITKNKNAGEDPVIDSSMVDVVIPDLSKIEKSGEDNFLKYCAACHGIGGAGQKGVAPPLIHKIYEPSHHGDIAFYYAAERGVRSHHWPFGNMPPVKGIKKTEVQGIIVYIRAVQRANGIN